MAEQTIQGCWLKLVEAAQALGVSEITLRRKIKGGKIPHDFRNGKYYVYVHNDSHSAAYSDLIGAQSNAPFAHQRSHGSSASARHAGMHTAHYLTLEPEAPSPAAPPAAAPPTVASIPRSPTLNTFRPSQGGGFAAAVSQSALQHANQLATHLATQREAQIRSKHGTSGIDWSENEVRMLAAQHRADQKDVLIRTLHRTIEDQQTLIAFLEDAIKKIAVGK